MSFWRRFWPWYQRTLHQLATQLPLALLDLLLVALVLLTGWLLWQQRPGDLLVLPALLMVWLLTLRLAVQLFRQPLPPRSGAGTLQQLLQRLRQWWRWLLQGLFLLLCLLVLAFSLKFAGVILRALSS